MAFDSTLSKAVTRMRSGEIRDNLNALNGRIDTIPAGPKGETGEPGGTTAAGDGEVSAGLDEVAADVSRLSLFPRREMKPTHVGCYGSKWARPYTGDFSDPPTQQEMRDHRDYMESFRQSMVR